jgi:hypothetical protein
MTLSYSTITTTSSITNTFAARPMNSGKSRSNKSVEKATRKAELAARSTEISGRLAAARLVNVVDQLGSLATFQRNGVVAEIKQFSRGNAPTSGFVLS